MFKYSRLKAVNEITARQTRTSLRRHAIQVMHLTTQIEIVLPTFKSWTVQKIIDI